MALVRIQVRRDTASAWTAANPVLQAGEPGLETDTGRIKYGDGVRNWNTLPYSSGVSLATTAPPTAGSAAVGTSQTAARSDHSHALPSAISAQTLSSTGNTSVGGGLAVAGTSSLAGNTTVGGTLNVTGPLVGGAHQHDFLDIVGLSDAIYARLVSAIKAGQNVSVSSDPSGGTITISATGTTATPLTISLQPTDVTTSNDSATFVAAGIGGSGVISYLWQVSTNSGATWTDLLDATGASLTLTGVNSNFDGNRYRVRVSSGNEVIFSSAATLRTAIIAITAEPPDATVDIGQEVRLAVTAAAGSAAVSYQWQRRPDAASSWANITDATQPVYAFSPSAPTDSDGDQYRAIASASGRTATSRTATVIVRAPGPYFVSQPSDTLDASGAASFSANVAGGQAPVTFQWQRLNGTSATWAPTDAFADITSGTTGTSGHDAATLSLTGQTSTQHNRRYRLVVTDALSRTATSREAVLRTLSLEVVKHPNNVSAVDGDTLPATAFQAEGTADGGVTYQWQKSVNGGTTWTNIAGATAATYGSIAVAYSDDGALFRCAITGDGQTLYTNSASLAVSPPPLVIATQPTNQSALDGEAEFSFSHTGGPPGTPTIYWETKAGSSAFTQIPSSNSLTLSLTGLTIDDNGRQYRAVVQNGAAIATTNTVTLSVPGVRIFRQPSNATAVSGSASFTVDFTTVACSSPTLVWEYRESSGSSWGGTGVDTKTLTLTGLNTAWNGYQYRAVITCGTSVTNSAVAILTVPTPPVTITTQPSNATASLGIASFSFAFTGGDGSTPVISWQSCPPGGSFSTIVGATSNTLSLTDITTAMSGTQYRATVQIGSQTVTTRAAVLTVAGAAITLHPADAVASNGTATFTFDFSVTACTTPFIEWEKKPSSSTAWEPLTGENGKQLRLEYLAPSDGDHQYRASVTCGGSTTYSSIATLTVPSYEFFLSQPASQNAKSGQTVTFSYVGRFPATTYKARWQSRKSNVASWVYQTPADVSAQSHSIIADPFAHHNTQWRVEIELPGGGKLYSNVATLSVDVVTSSFVVSTPGTADIIGIAYAKGNYVALTSDQTALARVSSDGGKTWTLSFLPSSQYWDGIVATSQGTLLAYSSGDSGLYKLGGTNTARVWVPDPAYPAYAAKMARSLDGGKTWQSTSFPFFVGSSLRIWAFPYQNTLVAFFREDSSTNMPVFTSGSYKGQPSSVIIPNISMRRGVARMAVSTNNGLTWTKYSLPGMLSAEVTGLYKLGSLAGIRADASYTTPGQVAGGDSLDLHKEITSCAMSDGVFVATSRDMRWTGLDYTDTTGDYATAGGYQLLYRNVGSSGWGPLLAATTSTVGVSTGVSVNTGKAKVEYRYRWRLKA